MGPSRPRGYRPVAESSALLGTVLLDCHAHYYRSYDPTVFLERADANLRCAAKEVGVEGEVFNCLLVAETAQRESLPGLVVDCTTDVRSDCSCEGTEEDSSFVATLAGRNELFLIGGQQLITREGLELLVFDSPTKLLNGRPLVECLESARARNAISIVPWGFGKWWFERGKFLQRALPVLAECGAFLGDSRTRPSPSFTPRIFRLARRYGIRVLAGTDPLPFRGQVQVPGSYGSVLSGSLSKLRPAASLKALLRQNNGRTQTFGRRSSHLSFGAAQVAMQVRKRRGRKQRRRAQFS